jgi:hypothetical protein
MKLAATMDPELLYPEDALMLVGAIPASPYNRSSGYAPSGTLGAVPLVLLILVLLGRV